jgi:hypothetical protein
MANKDSYAIAAFSSEGNNEVDSDMNVFRADGHYKFDDKFLGFITKIDAGVRQSDRSVEVERSTCSRRSTAARRARCRPTARRFRPRAATPSGRPSTSS